MKNTEMDGESPRSYGDKVERIYRVLLSRKLKDATWYRIAKEADVAYGWAHAVLKGLEQDGIIEGRRLNDPMALFARWAGREDRRRYREYHVQEPAAVLKGARMDFALTGYFAENLVGRYLFPRRYELYVHLKDASAWHTHLTGNGYVGKGNVQIILGDEHVFFERFEVDGWPVVAVQQLIVDLLREGAECVEAAGLLVGRHYRA
jgi:hypothetical protein